MEILNKLKSNENLAIALGFFDGIHLGHKAVIMSAVNYAKKHHIKSAVVTFRQSPYVAMNNVKPNYIMTLEEKIRAIKKLGVDYLYLSDFTEDLAKQTASDYLKTLVDNLHPKMIVTGFNHYFGYNKSGGVDYLRLMQSEYGYEFKEISPIKLQDGIISSSEIRKALSEGDLQKANAMLGYRFYVKNEVIRGRQIGRTIGFKTANLRMPEKILNIPDGVYAVEIEVFGKKHMGIANFGSNPTVTDDTQKFLEVHIIDFNENIYGQIVKVNFLAKIRDEKKFQSLTELKTQIKKDIECLK